MDKEGIRIEDAQAAAAKVRTSLLGAGSPTAPAPAAPDAPAATPLKAGEVMFDIKDGDVVNTVMLNNKKVCLPITTTDKELIAALTVFANHLNALSADRITIKEGK